MGNTTAFTTPSQALTDEQAALAARGELFDGLGRRKIVTPETVGTDKPKLIGYTRATSFIGALEDKTALEKWKTRKILEGAADANLEMSAMSALQNRLDADPDDKDADKAYRAELDEIAERAFNYAGGHDSADYGTALHRLVELYNDGTITDAIIEETERQWPGITADFHSYVDAWLKLVAELGASIVLQECLVVDDAKKVAGRGDMIARMKLDGDKRARRIFMDIKTGKIDNTGRLSQQLAIYAGGKLYDPETGRRSPLRVRQDVAIVVHVPRGEARTEFILIDLAPGRRDNDLCMKVRASRRKKKGITRTLAEVTRGDH